MKKEITFSLTEIYDLLSEYVCLAPDEGCNCKKERKAVENFIDRLKRRKQKKEECPKLCKPPKVGTRICRHGRMFVTINR